jgi:hypothetical protein
MIISTKHKFLFIHIPKNAGTSLMKALEPHAKKSDLTHFLRAKKTKHQTYADVLDLNNKVGGWKSFFKPNLENYFKFAVVRNPFDRMVSLYHYLQKPHVRPDLNTDISFIEFLRELKDPESPFQGLHSVKTQAAFVTLGSKKIEMDKICRFENLTEDLTALEGDLGVKLEMPTRNVSDHKGYKEYYADSEAMDIVLDRFDIDFDLFQYSRNID